MPLRRLLEPFGAFWSPLEASKAFERPLEGLGWRVRILERICSCELEPGDPSRLHSGPQQPIPRHRSRGSSSHDGGAVREGSPTQVPEGPS